MATVLDSFVLTFGLDASKFIDGQKQAEASMKKTRDTAVKHGKDLEESNRKFAASFDLVKKQAVEFFALIVGANGIKDFIADVTNATAALGRLSSNLNVSPQTLGAWGAAIERLGGNASEASSDFQALSGQLYDFHQNGKNIPTELQRMAAEAGVKIDTEHGIPGYLRSIGKASAELTRKQGGDRSDSFNFLTHAEIGPGMAQVLIDNGQQLDKFIGPLKDIAPTDDEIKRFESLQTSLVATQQEATKAGRAIVVELTPMIEGATKAITDFVKENEVAWKGDAVSGVKSFASGLSEVRDVAQDVVYWLNKIVDGEKWLGAHSPGAAAAAIVNKYGPQHQGSGEATPIPWEQWLGGATRWFEDNWGVKDAHGGTLDDLRPGRGNSGPHPAAGPMSDRKGSGPHPAPTHHWGPWHAGGSPTGAVIGGGSGPHPASGLAVEGRAVSRGNPVPVVLVQSGTGDSGGGFWSWLFGKGSGGGGSAPADATGPASSNSGPAAGGNFVSRATGAISHALFGGSASSSGAGKILPNGSGLGSEIGKYMGLREDNPEDLQKINAYMAEAGVNYKAAVHEWCAGWVNAQLAHEGIKGSGSLMANSFFNYGSPVKAQEAKAGDVMVLANGSHVGRYTGKSRIVGGALQYEMYSGNSGGAGPGRRAVSDAWYGPGSVYFRHPPAPAFSQPHRPASHASQQHLSTMSALHPVTTSSTSNEMHNQIHIHGVDTNNARSVADRITDALRQTQLTTTANFGQA